MWCHFLLLVLLCLCSPLASSSSLPDELDYADFEGSRLRLDLVRLEAGYHGLVRENETKVEVTPKIRAVGAQACSFRITNKHHGEAPFQVVIVDQERGLAELHAKKPLNCEKRKNYKFDIAAIDCQGYVTDSATVHISVLDVNEYPPVWEQPAYIVQVEEGRLYDEIVQVRATDQDCSPKYGDICKYEIQTTDQPFTVDSEGSIRNTEALDYSESHNHILSVLAYDCGMRRSQPVMVTVRVNRVCHLGWKGVASRMEYTPGSGRLELFPEAGLELCDVPCDVSLVRAHVNLHTTHIGKGCDRDTYSVESQRKLCGADKEAIDLLPSPTLGTEWTKSLPSDGGHEAEEVFSLDGATHAAVVPSGILSPSLSETFTMSVWLKHSQSPDFDKHHKEHILCSADDHKMSRHHFSLFVRNCRLIMLLRREFTEGDLNTFKPAEWRWKLPQVCDDQWHHYAVSVRNLDLELFVDGRSVRKQGDNPEIIDDWPLHPTQGINTTLTIGACWQGSEGKFKHYFRGYLAGLSILLHKNEKPEVLSCLHRCQESLGAPPRELLEPGMELLANTDLTDLTIEGDNLTNLESLLRRISYSNSREFPTPGRRDLRLATSIVCDSGKTLKVPVVNSYVMVLQPQQPRISINGTPNVAFQYEDFRRGVKVFNDVRISVATDKEEEQRQWKNGEPLSVISHKLDSCSVSVFPSLNPDHETLSAPENLLGTVGISTSITKDGITLTGADMVFNYEQVLRQIHYMNQKPAYYLNRAFKLVCSELNGRFISNEYQQTLTVIHPQSQLPKPSSEEEEQQHEHLPQVAHAMVDKHHVQQFKPSHTMNEVYLTSSVIETTQAATGASHALTIIVVVCLGFVVFIIVLGVIRIRAAHQRGGSRHDDLADQEMAWDDSSLTITVNPMEQIERAEASPLTHESDSDSSDDESAALYEEESSDEECAHRSETDTKTRDLEWDNSTLSI